MNWRTLSLFLAVLLGLSEPCLHRVIFPCDGRPVGCSWRTFAQQPNGGTADFGLNPNGSGGAVVVDSGFNAVSRGASAVYAHRLPDPATGEASQDPALSFKYDFLGRQVERLDARGITIRAKYDDLDRLTEQEVGWYDGGDWAPGYPPAALYAAALEPASRIGYVTYEYGDDLRTYTATARTKKTGGEVVSQVKQEYDARGNLEKDWQSFGATVTSNTPKTVYTWSYAATDPAETPGRNRLSGMDYPRYAPANNLRTVDIGYGTSEAPPDALGLWREVESTKNSVTKQAAKFGWVGSGRRCWRTFAQQTSGTNGGTIDYRLDSVLELTNGKIGLLGLDSWGRTATLSFHIGPPTDFDAISSTDVSTVFYTHDLAGRRTVADRVPDLWATLPNSGSEKEANTYDGLSRLQHFKFTNSNGSTTRLEQDWDLDLLGNWIERETTTPTPVTDVRHFTDERNRITSVETQVGNNSPTTKTFIYDAAGNLCYDGTYAFQYDAWNRLVSVHTAGLVGSPQSPPIPSDITLTLLVKHSTYDALGRLARTLSPYPSPAQQSGGALRSERFYYDGIRRLVEVQIDTVKSLAGAIAAGGGLATLANDALALSNGDIDQSAAPAAYEVAYIAAASPTVTTPREYVWGPGDRGIDELLVQFDGAGTAIWVLQDEGGDIIAAADNGGTGDTARRVGLWSYGPYGEVARAVTTVSHAPIRAGHKGLFVDRLDAGVALPIGGIENPRLVAGSTLLGSMRGRTGHYSLGRFLQQDPNASGLSLITQTAHGGVGLVPGIDPMDIDGLNGDGPSFYQYCGSGPWMYSDPLGLEYSLIQTAGVAGIISALLNGTMEAVFNPRATWGSVGLATGRGFVAGAAAGAAGWYASAYAASASGLFSSLWTRGALEGVVWGGTDALLARRSLQDTAAEVFFSGLTGGVVGKIGSVVYARATRAWGGMFAAEAGVNHFGRTTIAGQPFEYLLDYSWQGSRTLVLEGALYPVGREQAKIGVATLRAFFRQEVAKKGFDAGADTVIIRFTRQGTTGGLPGRQVEWVFRKN